MKYLIIAVISFYTIGCLTPPYNEVTTVNINLKTIGIDISHHQGKIDWDEFGLYKDNPICFIYIKATEGSTYQDPMYSSYVDGVKDKPIPLGSYHYFRTSSPVVTQFQNFMSVVNIEEQDLIPMIDIEECKNWKGQMFHDSLKLFLNLVEDSFGSKPILYTVNSFYNSYMRHKYKDYYLCVGRYSKHQPNLFDGHSWILWQYTEFGVIPGIEKNVDIDFINPNYNLTNLKIKKNGKEKI